MWPIVEPIRGGWTAIGDGWAVYASTRDEAILEYRTALGGGQFVASDSELRPIRLQSRQAQGA